MKYAIITTAAVITLSLSACGGTKVLKESQPMQTVQPLAAVSEQRVSAILDWVIVRDGPGTWARNADWDEYLLRVSNLSDRSIQVTGLIVVDSLDTRIDPEPGRKQLVKASKKTAKLYKKERINVKAGRGAGTMIAAGAAVTVIGVGAAYGAAGAALSGSAFGAGATAAVGGLLLLGPALAVGGIVRGVNNSAVNRQIEQRQTILPLEIRAGEELTLDVFFPIAPSPRMVEVSYTDANGQNTLIIDVSAALKGLHMVASNK